MSIGLKFQTIEARSFHALGGINVIFDDALDVPFFHLLREGAVRCFAAVRWRYHWQPVGFIPTGTATQVSQLNHHGSAVFMTLVGQILHPSNHFVLVRQHVVEHRRTVARYRGGTGGHGQCHASLGTFDVVSPIQLFGHAVDRICRFVRGGMMRLRSVRFLIL
ncbi:hypothetical protein D3C80_1109830 [compost metagenome]